MKEIVGEPETSAVKTVCYVKDTIKRKRTEAREWETIF